MSARFAELMALSASQTRESDLASKAILEGKKRKEEERKKLLEEKERKEQELQARLIKKRMEDQLREEERRKKAAEEKQRKEHIMALREEEQRRALRYGPKSKSGGGSGSGGGRGRKPQGGSDSGDELDTGAMGLTREEKRKRKLMLDMNRSGPSRKAVSSTRNKAGRMLQGGAVDVIAPQNVSFSPSGALDASLAGLSVKERIAMTPNYLQPLNTKKRDMRTIDEIMRDRQKEKEAKILAGDEAREFHDWFGTNKKKVEQPSPVKKAASSQSSISPSPSRAITPNTTMPKPAASKPRASASVPTPRTTTPDVPPKPERKEPRTKVTMVKPEPKGSIHFQKVTSISNKPSGALQPVKSSLSKSSTMTTSRTQTSLTQSASSVSSKKRARSYDDEFDLDSEDLDSPPPTKRRPVPSSGGRSSISSEIWKIFGKDRDRYVKADVYSDEDDDMEVDADALRKEELRRFVHIFLVSPLFSHISCL